jgi:hypothetical protein
MRQKIKNIAGPRWLQFVCSGTEREDMAVVNYETHQVKARRCYRASGSILRACLQIYAIHFRTRAARKLHELESHLPHPGCEANSDQNTLAPAQEQSTILTKVWCCIQRSTLAQYWIVTVWPVDSITDAIKACDPIDPRSDTLHDNGTCAWPCGLINQMIQDHVLISFHVQTSTKQPSGI